MSTAGCTHDAESNIVHVHDVCGTNMPHTVERGANMIPSNTRFVPIEVRVLRSKKCKRLIVTNIFSKILEKCVFDNKTRYVAPTTNRTNSYDVK